MRNSHFFSIVLLSILSANIISQIIIIPENENSQSEDVKLSQLRGNRPKTNVNPIPSTKMKIISELNQAEVTKSYKPSQCFPIRYNIEGGEENDVDSNLSDVDNSADIGSEVDFSNAQGTNVDSQFMKIQEVSPDPPSITVDSVSIYNGTTSTIDFNHTISGTNRLLLVYIHVNIGTTVTSVIYDGTPLILINRTESFAKPPPGPSVEIWQRLNPSPGFASGTVTLAAADDVAVAIVSYTGVDQTTPIEGLETQTIQTDNSSITIASRTGDLVQDVFASISTGIPTEGSTQNRRWMGEMGSTNRWGVGSTKTGASSVTFNWETDLLKDSVHIGFNIRRAVSPYELDLEYQWTSAEYRRQSEELAIRTGDLGAEDLRVDIWDGIGSWVPLISSLTANSWNNVSITGYLTSPMLTIRFKDTEEINDFTSHIWDIDLILIVISAENIAPSAENLTLSPDPLMSNETLLLDYTYSDPNNDNESGTEIRWYKYNSTGDEWNLLPAYNDSYSIPASALIKNDIWRATVKPKDDIEFGNISTSSNITVQNTPPKVQSPSILPDHPKTVNELTISYSWSDPDIGDTDSNSIIYWYKDNGTGFILQTLFTNESFILSTATRKNDSWKFEIIPSDGEGFGNIIASPEIIIENSLPVLFVTINDYSTPQTILDHQNLNANYSYFDADNQDNPSIDAKNESSLNIRWYKYNSSSGVFEIVATDIFTIDNSSTQSGDLWRVEMNISDGSAYSSYFTSPTMSIDQAPNQLPSAIWINLTKSDAKANEFLFVDFTYSDTDGSNDSGTGESIRWYKNTVYQPQFDDIRNLTTAQLVRGDEWFAEVRVRDEYDWGNWSTSETITIENSAPTVVSIEILTSTGTTLDILRAYYIPTDIDGDSINLTLSKIFWLNNSVLVPSLENHTEVPSSFTKKDQEWKFEVYLYDGYEWSRPFLSPGITIKNSKPSIFNVTLMGGRNTTDDIILTFDFIDSDGDTEDGTQIIWFIGVEFLPLTTNKVLLSSNPSFIAGKSVGCLIYISDGEYINFTEPIFSSDYAGGAIDHIGNSDPEFVTGPNIQNTEGSLIFTVETGIKVIYSATDADQEEGNTLYGITENQGYVAGSHYRWYKNGELTSFTGTSVDLSELEKWDIWVVSVKLEDNADGTSDWTNSSEILIINTPPDLLNLWFVDNSTGIRLNETSHVNISVKIDFVFDDPDSIDKEEGYEDIQIYWYWSNGIDPYELKSEFTNKLWINSVNLSKGDYWLIQVSVFDGEAWSPIKNTSKALRIVNSDSIISNLHFVFDSNNDLVDPQSRVDEFYVENEDINITYKYEDFDNDPENIRIRWFVQYSNGSIFEVPQYENATLILADATSPGELWWAMLTTYDESLPGMQINSSHIFIMQHPEIEVLTPIPEKINDGAYSIGITLLNYNSSEVISVQFAFSFGEVLSGISNGTGSWYCSINMTDQIDTTIEVIITAYMSVSGTEYVILSYGNISFLVQDLTEPRVKGIPIIISDDADQPTNITIYVYVEENYSEIVEVLLYYTLTNLTGSGSMLIQFGEIGPLPLSLENTSGSISLYVVTLSDLQIFSNKMLNVTIFTRDSLNNTNSYTFQYPILYTSEPFPTSTPPNLWEMIIPIIISMFALFLAVSTGYFFYQRRKDKSSAEKKAIDDKLAFLTDTYTILVTSAAGVPVWNISNVFYKTDESLTGTLSGLSVGIDAFLESFQNDFISQMSDINLSRDHPDVETTYRLSVIEQNKIQIMILGSVSYRIFVFLQKVPSSFLRNTFLTALKDLQKNFPLYDTGIINEDLLGPNIRRILRKHLPIGLLEPFKIDLELLAYFDSILKQKPEESPLSRGALNVLKFLVVTSLTPPTSSSTKQALLKRYDQLISEYPQRHSGILLYSDAMKILSQVGGFPLKDISEALWMGIDDRIKILIPF